MQYRDEYGFHAHLAAAHDLFSAMQRGEGRTTAMLDALKSGDLVVVATAEEVRRVQHQMRDRVRPKEAPAGFVEPRILFASADYTGVDKIMQASAKLADGGALILSHDWVDAFWRFRLRDGLSTLESLVTRFGRGAGPQPFDRPVTSASRRLLDEYNHRGLGRL